MPSIKEEDLMYARGFGGVRPQLIDKNKKKLLLGEGKIMTGMLCPLKIAKILHRCSYSPSGCDIII